jgi:hypothetical protein
LLNLPSISPEIFVESKKRRTISFMTEVFERRIETASKLNKENLISARKCFLSAKSDLRNLLPQSLERLE